MTEHLPQFHVLAGVFLTLSSEYGSNRILIPTQAAVNFWQSRMEDAAEISNTHVHRQLRVLLIDIILFHQVG